MVGRVAGRCQTARDETSPGRLTTRTEVFSQSIWRRVGVRAERRSSPGFGPLLFEEGGGSSCSGEGGDFFCVLLGRWGERGGLEGDGMK